MAAAAIGIAEAVIQAFLSLSWPVILKNMLMAFFKDFLFEFILKKVIPGAFLSYFMINIIIICLGIIIKLICEVIVSGILSCVRALVVSDTILNNPLVLEANGKLQIVATAVALLLSSYAAFKIFFAYMGFEAEEPAHVLGRAVVSIVAIFASLSIAQIYLGIHTKTIEIMWTMFNVNPSVDLQSGPLVDFLCPPGIDNILADPNKLWSASIDMLLFFFWAFKIIQLMARFGKRFVFTIVIVVFSPLAYACIASKSTSNAFRSSFKLFLGNMIIQNFQIAIFALSLVIPSTLNLDNHFLTYLLIIGCIELMDNLESLVSAMGFSTGPGGDPFAFNMGASFSSTMTKVFKPK